MIRTQIQLTDEQYSRLKQLAARRDVSLAELVRAGVEDVLQSAEGIGAGERRARALAVTGMFRSGLRDLSVEHDRYLAEAYSE